MAFDPNNLNAKKSLIAVGIGTIAFFFFCMWNADHANQLQSASPTPQNVAPVAVRAKPRLAIATATPFVIFSGRSSLPPMAQAVAQPTIAPIVARQARQKANDLGAVFPVRDSSRFIPPATHSTRSFRSFDSGSSDGSGASQPVQRASGTCTSGATAICSDGSTSYAASHRGACSHHGGVANWCD